MPLSFWCWWRDCSAAMDERVKPRLVLRQPPDRLLRLPRLLRVLLLRVFTDVASGFSTSDVRDAQDQIVQFSTAGELIWTPDGTSFSGYAGSGAFVNAEALCKCWFEVRFGVRDGAAASVPNGGLWPRKSWDPRRSRGRQRRTRGGPNERGPAGIVHALRSGQCRKPGRRDAARGREGRARLYERVARHDDRQERFLRRSPAYIRAPIPWWRGKKDFEQKLARSQSPATRASISPWSDA